MRWPGYVFCLLTAAVVFSAAAPPTHALTLQDEDAPDPTVHVSHTPPAPMGAGLQLGVPTGFSVKNYLSPSVAVTGALVWDLETFSFASAQLLYEHPFLSTPLNAFIGPGVMAGPGGFKDTHDFTVGLQGMAGVNMFIGNLEPFLALTPIVTLNVATQGYIGTTFGMRFYL